METALTIASRSPGVKKVRTQYNWAQNYLKVRRHYVPLCTIIFMGTIRSIRSMFHEPRRGPLDAAGTGAAICFMSLLLAHPPCGWRVASGIRLEPAVSPLVLAGRCDAFLLPSAWVATLGMFHSVRKAF